MATLRWHQPYIAPFFAKRHAENAAPSRRAPVRLKKLSLALYAFVLACVVGWKVVEIEASCHSQGKPVTVQLTRGPYVVLDFPSKLPVTHAIVLFGSGDGGWSGFEEEIALTMQKNGYEVIGIDSASYAETDYDLTTLQADFDTIAARFRQLRGANPPPVIVGGWSMGAAQAIAVGGGPHPPQGLAGLLLLDPCSRGRYGLRLSDRTDFLPTGDGTFGVADFADALGHLRIVQWHADEDMIDSRTWLSSLKAPHEEYDFAQTGHYYSRGREDFLVRLVASVPWILGSGPQGVSVTGGRP